MDLNKISTFIKNKRKALGVTQEELAERLFVTEKAISRWETGRGTPDISLLIPLSKELNTSVSELLNGEEKKNDTNEVEQLIEYSTFAKNNKFNIQFKLIFFFYILSILSFLLYLKFEYDPNVHLNYFVRLFITVIASTFVIIGNEIYANNYVEKLDEKKKIKFLSQSIVFVYYIILLFNMVIFARYSSINSYNLIPFKSILDILQNGSIYAIIINILGNLLIFIPLEYFIITLFKVNKLSINFILSVSIILIIELIQLIFKIGVFDIDDIILCMLGMMLFYLIYNRHKKYSR